MAREGAMFTSWYGQASSTAGRASFITGRIPIRSALSIVIGPGDRNFLRKETPTIAEFFQKNGYATYFSGEWHLGDTPESYPTEHGFHEMKHFAAYYAGVYGYEDTDSWMHPWFPTFNPQFMKSFDEVTNLGEWEGVAGQKAKMVGTITYDSLATIDIRQTDSAITYIKDHSKNGKPWASGFEPGVATRRNSIGRASSNNSNPIPAPCQPHQPQSCPRWRSVVFKL